MAARSKPQRPWLLYLLECAGNKLYAGISPDPEARFRQHLRGGGARFTRANPPLRILAAQAYQNRAAASAAEHALKKMRRPAKLLWARDRTWQPAPETADALDPSKAKPRRSPATKPSRRQTLGQQGTQTKLRR